MKKIALTFASALIFCSCSSLNHHEQVSIRSLQSHGITIDKPTGNWDKPASPAGAALLNILPGFGNFYLAMGNAGDSSHYVYGALNLLVWPISVLWGVPEAAIDANSINKRELIYYYTFDAEGKQALADRNLAFSSGGKLEEIKYFTMK